MKLVVAVVAVVLCALTGCNSQRVVNSHAALRRSVMTLLDEQVMDNLVRAKRGEPMLHLNYKGFSGKSSYELNVNGKLADSDDATVTNGTIVQLDKGGSDISAGGKMVDELAMSADPVTGDAAAVVYGAYRKFVEDGHLKDQRPGAADSVYRAHVWRGRKPSGEVVEQLYWVDEGSKDDYVKLVELTTHTQKAKEEKVATKVEVVVRNGAQDAWTRQTTTQWDERQDRNQLPPRN